MILIAYSRANKIQAFNSWFVIKSHQRITKTHQTTFDLHQTYIVVPIDKASGNVAIICKIFYALILTKQMKIL